MNSEPRVEIAGSENSFKTGDSTTLMCEVHGIDILDSPTKSYVWSNGSTSLTGQVESSLMLGPLTTADIGSYTCTVTIRHNLLSTPIIKKSECFQVNVVGKVYIISSGHVSIII